MREVRKIASGKDDKSAFRAGLHFLGVYRFERSFRLWPSRQNMNAHIYRCLFLFGSFEPKK